MAHCIGRRIFLVAALLVAPPAFAQSDDQPPPPEGPPPGQEMQGQEMQPPPMQAPIPPGRSPRGGGGTPCSVRSGNCPSLSRRAARWRTDCSVSDVPSWCAVADVQDDAGLKGWQNGRDAARLWTATRIWPAARLRSAARIWSASAWRSAAAGLRATTATGLRTDAAIQLHATSA